MIVSLIDGLVADIIRKRTRARRDQYIQSLLNKAAVMRITSDMMLRGLCGLLRLWRTSNLVRVQGKDPLCVQIGQDTHRIQGPRAGALDWLGPSRNTLINPKLYATIAYMLLLVNVLPDLCRCIYFKTRMHPNSLAGLNGPTRPIGIRGRANARAALEDAWISPSCNNQAGAPKVASFPLLHLDFSPSFLHSKKPKV